MKNNKKIYSEYLENYIPAGFTVKRVLFSRDGAKPYTVCHGEHFTWNEEDLYYYSDDTDEHAYMDIPTNGAKTYTLKESKTARKLVILD